MSEKNNIIIYCEIDEIDGRPIVADVSLELLTKGRHLADRLGVKLCAVAIGRNLNGVANQVMSYGVDILYRADDQRLFPYTTLPHAAILCGLFAKIEPQICLMGATCIGRDLGPRVSSAYRSGLTADCTELEIGDHTDVKSGREYTNLLYQIRPAFGGNIVATIVNPDHRPQMATVREGVMRKEIFDANHKGEIIDINVDDFVKNDDFVVEIINREIQRSSVNLKGAQIVVAGGYGMGSRENFALLFDLAKTLGAEVGASRAAIDAGFADTDRQIGQTGVTVRPKLYIACGISGQIQHVAGMKESAMIISINNDPQAPINDIADYSIIGNVEDVLPKFINYYKKHSK